MDAYVASYELGTNRPSTKLKIASTVKNRFGRLKAYQIRELEPRRVSVRVNADPVWTEDAKKILTQFNSWQRNHFATATWSRDNKLLSSIGIWAVKNGYCDYNPFSILPSKSMVNDERNQYVEADSVISAMDSCLDPDTRITIALGRFGGFRTPSESATLKWSMVDFDRGTIDVMDSKKQKLRRMPMFERLREELQRRRTDSGRKSGFVVSDRDRASSNANNFNLIREAVERSGQDPWPRLRQNLRASCENDLLKLFDERRVTAWLGHTISVSRNHYQKQRDIDYREAADEWSKFQQSN
jgi:integrase